MICPKCGRPLGEPGFKVYKPSNREWTLTYFCTCGEQVEVKKKEEE